MKEIAVYDNLGKQIDTIQFAAQFTDNKASSAYAVSVRSLLQSWRQGTVGCKTRGEVSFSNRKPWKQKGTGRARAGSLRSPLWRKGGVLFGPQPRVREISVSRKQRRLAMAGVFAQIVASSNLHCVDATFVENRPSTKLAYQVLRGLGVAQKKVVVFLGYEDVSAYLSFRNIPNVNIVFYSQPNAYTLSDGQCWLFLKKDINLLTGMVEQWN